MLHAHVARFDVTGNLKNFAKFFRNCKQGLNPKTVLLFKIRALFSSENFWEMDTVAFSFVFDKYCPIMD